MGYRHVPWLGVTYFCLVIQMILGMLTQMHRKDFVTMTVCTLGFYFLTYPENVRRSQFRLLVLLIALSIGQDIFWFMLNRDVEDDDDDGGVERSVKTFSRKLSYVSFAWRVSTQQQNRRLIPSVVRLTFLSLSYLDSSCCRSMERLLRFHHNREGQECGRGGAEFGGARKEHHPQAQGRALQYGEHGQSVPLSGCPKIAGALTLNLPAC